MAGGVLFGREAWNPWQISGQIIAVQALYYLSLGVLYKLVVGPYVPGLSLHDMFDWRRASFRSFQGWMVTLATVANALLAAFVLRYIVRRAKKCLDFAGTILLLHLAAVACISGFPRSAAWWVLHGTDVAITALLGEWLCMQKELQEIPMTSLRRERAAAGTTAMAARASGSGGAGSAAAANGSASSSAAVGGGINLARSAANTRSSTANVMELGRVDHSADRQFSKEWAPLSPVDLTKSVQPPPPPR